MRVLNREHVEAVLTLPACIAVMDGVMRALAEGRARLPLRPVVPLENSDLLLLMPAALTGEGGAVGVKLLTLFGDNPARGLPAIQGLVVLFDPHDGRVVAVADAASVTAIRTAAVSAVAARLLANPEAGDLALLGSGAQASTHLSAMRAVRPIRRVRVWSRTPEHAHAFAQHEGHKHGLSIEVCPTPDDAVRDADLICACTAAVEPVLHSHAVADGAHVCAVGAYTADMRECDSALVQRAGVWVDSHESAWHEAGDLIQPLREGVITQAHVVGTLGEALLGRVAGRTAAQQVTLFKSCGLAAQDVAAVRFLAEAAQRAELGVDVPW